MKCDVGAPRLCTEWLTCAAHLCTHVQAVRPVFPGPESSDLWLALQSAATGTDAEEPFAVPAAHERKHLERSSVEPIPRWPARLPIGPWRDHSHILCVAVLGLSLIHISEPTRPY